MMSMQTAQLAATSTEADEWTHFQTIGTSQLAAQSCFTAVTKPAFVYCISKKGIGRRHRIGSVYFSRMSDPMNRPRRLVPTAILGLVAIGAACQNTDTHSPDTAALGGTTATGGLGHGGNASGGSTGSGGTGGDDGSFGNPGSDDASADDGPNRVAEDTARTDSVSTNGIDGRPDGASPDAYSSTDLPLQADLLVRLDAPVPFWSGELLANCTPPTINGRQQTDGHHHAGEDCMTSGCHRDPELAAHHGGTDCRGSGCHSQGSPDGSGAPAFLFGGTIYRPSTLLSAPAVEVAVRTNEGFFSACSASNGNFWRLAPSRTAPPLTWASAEARVRNVAGEAVMTTTPTSGCNAALCHGEKQRLTSP